MVDLDPLSPAEYFLLAIHLLDSRKYAVALATLRRAHALGLVSSLHTAFATAFAHAVLSDWAEAVQDCQGFVSHCLRATAIAEMKLGHVAQAYQAMAKFQTELRKDPIDYAGVYAQWGDRPAALHWLEVAATDHLPNLAQLRQFHDLDPVRDSPQYKNLERSIGLPP